HRDTQGAGGEWFCSLSLSLSLPLLCCLSLSPSAMLSLSLSPLSPQALPPSCLFSTPCTWHSALLCSAPHLSFSLVSSVLFHRQYSFLYQSHSRSLSLLFSLSLSLLPS